MEHTASNLVSIAKSQLGYLEKKSNKDLDSMTANAGSANWTKYGQWCGLNPAAWCAMFVSWCFGQLTGSKAEAQKMLCGFLWASCTQMYNAFKKAGRVYKEPKAGDIVVFNNTSGGSTMVHTGIVTDVKGGRVYTIEGNTSAASGVIANGGGVAAKSYALTYSRIGGYLRPYYAEAKTTKKPTTRVTVDTWLVKRGNIGQAVLALQSLLIGNGFNCGDIDGDFGPATESALKQYQKSKKLEADGECGKLTWTALLGG